MCVRGDEVSSLAAASGGLVTCTLDHTRFVKQHWVGIYLQYLGEEDNSREERRDWLKMKYNFHAL